ncbi:invasion associated locus B family protein [Celeribacter sp. PS-C1]|uniref:invasion associated locus B family protein n=1 Tax=Celeribacter sp. PS-C1 TaxID=2820813 RepID=UPI00210786D2|nr:invasion associated locus B family protein [Celeribacter sp. PS-C1]
MFSISRKITTLASATVLALSAALPLAAQDPGLSAGTPIAPTSNVGRAYTLETHGDWEVRCINAPEGQIDPCSLYQLLKDQDGTDVAEVALFHVGNDEVEAAATFTTPLETLLTAQLALFVDGENGRRYPFQFCNRVGCFVRAGLNTADIDLLKKGAEGMVGIVPLGRTDDPVRLTLSLSGFTAGYDKVVELHEAAQNGEGPSAPDEGEEAPAE